MKMASSSGSAIAFAATTIPTLLLLVAFCGAVSAHGPASAHEPVSASAPAPSSPDCMTVVLGLADCLSYVQEGSNQTKPDKACCPELKGLVDNNPVCLCYLLANSNNFGIKIDTNRALKLPSVCKVVTPPPSLCSIAGYPVAAPISSQVFSPGPQPSEGSPSSQSPAGAAANNDKGASNTVASCAMATVVALAIGIFLPTFF